MKTPWGFIFLYLMVVTISCNSNTNTDQLPENDSVTSVAKKEPDTLLAKLKAQAKPDQSSDTTIQTRPMRWQQVLVNENGTSYELMDNTGNLFSCIMSMPDFDFYNNKYFEAKYAPQAQFPTITFKEGVNETWFRVTIKTEYLTDEDSVIRKYSIIKAINPLN